MFLRVNQFSGVSNGDSGVSNAVFVPDFADSVPVFAELQLDS